MKENQTVITVTKEDRQALKLLAVKNHITIISMVNKLIKFYKRYEKTIKD